MRFLLLLLSEEERRLWNVSLFASTSSKQMTKKHFEGVGWINLAQDRFYWQSLLNTVINFAFHKKCEEC
jgi:hypothetical protein